VCVCGYSSGCRGNRCNYDDVTSSEVRMLQHYAGDGVRQQTCSCLWVCSIWTQQHHGSYHRFLVSHHSPLYSYLSYWTSKWFHITTLLLVGGDTLQKAVSSVISNRIGMRHGGHDVDPPLAAAYAAASAGCQLARQSPVMCHWLAVYTRYSSPTDP